MRRRSNDGATDLSWDDVKAEDKTLVYQVCYQPACFRFMTMLLYTWFALLFTANSCS